MRSLLLFLLLGTVASAARVEHTVQPGDTVYSLARKYGMTVDAVLSQNGMTTPDLRVGQVLVLDSPNVPAPAAPVTPASPSPQGAAVGTTPPAAVPAGTYTVAPGDTLYSLAKRFNTSVQAVMDVNRLASPDLRVGQVLVIPTASPAVTAVSVKPGVPLRDAAQQFIGIPYVYGGTTLRGLDCSGLVLQVLAPLGVTLPRRSADMFTVGSAVNESDLREGDLVFFDTEGQGGVTHVGIYLHDGHFVHANSYEGHVTISRLSEKYYATRYLGARRVLPPVSALGR